uniref:Uncharacterized protein n=1 Tax=Anguilla anguilla TaxID=7936 RepID=A0A0E9RQN7_ANGAN
MTLYAVCDSVKSNLKCRKQAGLKKSRENKA